MSHFVGGPLDSQPYVHTRGRRALFRHDDGTRMPTYLGDMIFGGRGARELSEGYALWGPDNLYVHASVWREVTRPS